MAASASGFCIFNDPVIVINSLLNRGLRVVYLDIDAHHGDGVQHSFYDNDSVLTISLHESGQSLFPGTGSVDEKGVGNGEGYSVNLPLAPYTGDETYNWAFENIVPPLIDSFGPDCIVTQLGIDTYHSDPLTHLYLSSEGFVSIVRSIKNISGGLPWVALGGGGYNLSAVARCWSLAYGLMSDQCLSDQLPESQGDLLGTGKLRDVLIPKLPLKVVEATRKFAETSVEAVKKTIFRYHM
jgi:acetoin utilization protein AcuC